MITNAQIKTVTSLKEKKYRKELNMFVVEGRKMTGELLKSNYEIINIFGTESWLQENDTIIRNKHIYEKTVTINNKELCRISSLKTPDEVLCVVRQKANKNYDCNLPFYDNKNQLIVALDNINNPGNLGTIIRLCVWFGIKNIICNENTVDCYNPKVLQSTMGAIFHTNLVYTNLYSFLQKYPSKYVYGTVLHNGKNIYTEKLSSDGVIIIGNESHGISDDILQMINCPITIPCFANTDEVESLNASVACGIILSEFKRR